MSQGDDRERRVVLEGALNFRDLGGYPAADGRRVRWGVVYRSDRLSDLTDADGRVLDGLELSLVCDLRSERERREKPNRLVVEATPQVSHIPVETDAGEKLQALLLAGERDVSSLRAVISGGYRDFVHAHGGAWSELLNALLAVRTGAAVFHCSAGQDRTGFAAALLLLALGVRREDVLEDYMLTDRFRPGEVAVQDMLDSPIPVSVLVDIWRPGPAFLRASFDAIDADYGSAARYLSAIGVDDATQRALRECFLA